MNYAVIFAGGVGRRMKSESIPKQFLKIQDKPIIAYTIEHFENHDEIDAICVVMVEDWLEHTREIIKEYGFTKIKWLVPGGKSALESQYNGLLAVAGCGLEQQDIVLIHDGVRPLIDRQVISNCIRGVKAHGSAVTVAPAIETIIQVDDDNMIWQTIPRDACQLARAPQAFYAMDILRVHERSIHEQFHTFIDSTSMMLHYGYKIHTVEGPSENIKITTPADYYVCKALLEAKGQAEI